MMMLFVFCVFMCFGSTNPIVSFYSEQNVSFLVHFSLEYGAIVNSNFHNQVLKRCYSSILYVVRYRYYTQK